MKSAAMLSTTSRRRLRPNGRPGAPSRKRWGSLFSRLQVSQESAEWRRSGFDNEAAEIALNRGNADSCKLRGCVSTTKRPRSLLLWNRGCPTMGWRPASRLQSGRDRIELQKSDCDWLTRSSLDNEAAEIALNHSTPVPRSSCCWSLDNEAAEIALNRPSVASRRAYISRPRCERSRIKVPSNLWQQSLS